MYARKDAAMIKRRGGEDECMEVDMKMNMKMGNSNAKHATAACTSSFLSYLDLIDKTSSLKSNFFEKLPGRPLYLYKRNLLIKMQKKIEIEIFYN